MKKYLALNYLIKDTPTKFRIPHTTFSVSRSASNKSTSEPDASPLEDKVDR